MTADKVVINGVIHKKKKRIFIVEQKIKIFKKTGSRSDLKHSGRTSRSR